MEGRETAFLDGARVVEHLVPGLVALFAVLHAHVGDEARETFGERRDHEAGVRRLDLLAHVGAEDGVVVGEGEKHASGGHVVEAGAEAVDVRPAVQLHVAVDLLGADVGGRAHHFVGLLLVLDGGGGLAEAEVRHLDRAVAVDHDVLGLEVAVDDAEDVPGVFHRVGDGLADDQHVDFGDVRLAVEERTERVAVHVVHDEVVAAIREIGAVALHDALVVEVRHRAHLHHELAHVLSRGGELRVEHLHGHGAVELAVPGAPDDGHAAAADDGLEPEEGDVGRRVARDLAHHARLLHLCRGNGGRGGRGRLLGGTRCEAQFRRGRHDEMHLAVRALHEVFLLPELVLDLDDHHFAFFAVYPTPLQRLQG